MRLFVRTADALTELRPGDSMTGQVLGVTTLGDDGRLALQAEHLLHGRRGILTLTHDPVRGLLVDGRASDLDRRSQVLAIQGRPSTFAFLRALHPGPDGVMELRAFKAKGGDGGKQIFVPLPIDQAGEDQIRAFARTYGIDRDLYVAIATRRDASSGRLRNCTALHALFVDIDCAATGTPIVAAWNRVSAFELPPSMIVRSGGGLHCYWALAAPIDLTTALGQVRASHWLGALAHAVGGDQASAEPAHVLRLPDTLNLKPKYGPTRPVVTLVDFDWRVRYSLDEIIDVFGDADPSQPAAPILAERTPIEHGMSREQRIAQAKSWLTRQAPAIAGHRGNDRAYAVACAVTRGHDLSVTDAVAVLSDWNARCQPPWSDDELRLIVGNANTYATGAAGEKLVEFPTTEAGDAEFFAERYGDHVRFDHRRRRWLLASAEGHWLPDQVDRLKLLVIEMMRERQQRASLVAEKDKKKKFFNWAVNGESVTRIDHTLTLARSVPPIGDAGDAWDSSPWLLGVPNGVIDLLTGSLRQATPDDRITMRAAVSYDASAKAPLWEKTVREVFNGDDDLIAYVQRAFGYSLTGDCREECLFFCWGDGANGKGTLMNTFASVLRDYADDLPFSALELHERSSIPNDVAKLVSKRFVTASESGDTTRLNEARIKALTGRDPLTARFMRAEFFTFQPEAKFWLATNKKPIVRDDSPGFWRRIHLIPFTQSFTDRENRTLKDSLRSEAPGILAWAVRGCLAWQREGLRPPDVVRNATAEYRKESDPLMPFFDACCVIQEGARVQASALYAAYLRWVETYRVRSRLSLVTFPREIKKRFDVDPADTRLVWYQGIGLRDSQRDSQAPAENDIPF